jgi:HSP20 family protein
MTEKNSKKENKSRDQKDEQSTALAVPGVPSLAFPNLFEEFMKPFDDFMGPLFSGSLSPFGSDLRNRQPNIDVQYRGDHYSLTAELPAFEKKDVEVRVGSNVIELKAEKKSEEKDTKGSHSSYSFFDRYVSLPERVLPEKVDGTMKNGILELKLPKVEPKPKDKSRRVHLN